MLSAYVIYTVHLTEINVDVTNDSRLSWAAYHALIQNPSTLLISGDMISHSKTMPVHWPWCYICYTKGSLKSQSWPNDHSHCLHWWNKSNPMDLAGWLWRKQLCYNAGWFTFRKGPLENSSWLKRHNQTKIFIFILAPWYVHNLSTDWKCACFF